VADSIAKLAVVITGDAGPLATALAKASANVDSWSRGMATMAVQNDKWLAGLEKMRPGSAGNANPFEAMRLGASGASGSIDRLNTASVKLSTTLSALRGNWGAAFSVGGPALLGITATILAVRKLATAGDDLLEKIGADELETWSGQWGRLNEQLGVTGLRFTEIAREATGDLADAMAGINQALFPDSVAHIEAIKAREFTEKRIKEQKEAAAKAAEKQAKANKEAAEAQQRERDAMLDIANARRDRAQSITDSLRTPSEELIAKFRELRELFAGGVIDQELFGQSGERMIDEAMDRIKRTKTHERKTEGIAAAERFTSSGASAVEASKREIERLAKISQQELEESKKAAMQRRELIDLFKKFQPVILQQGDL
jgi:hypothetical protein